jgi:signal transduction histidine kinase
MSYDQQPPPDTILITPHLQERAQRTPDYKIESEILGRCSHTLANSPDEILQFVSDEVMKVTGAQSAGISIAEFEGTNPILRWHATSGLVKPFLHGTMPRDFSPCGVVLQINSVQLMKKPAEFYTYIEGLGLNVDELLLAPFHRNGIPYGTVWAIHHTSGKQFDAEDSRILRSIANFCSSASIILNSQRIAEQAQNELIDAINHRDTFLSVASHELKTPLSSLLLQSQMFLRKRDEKTAEELLSKATSLAEVAVKQTTKLSRLVNEMLEVTRMKNGRLKFHKENFDFNTLVEEQIFRLKDQFLLKPSFHPCANGMGEWDKGRMEQVVQNLLLNAIAYGLGKEIDITLSNDEEKIKLEVKDQGIGITSESLAKIFNRFSRGDLEKSELRGLGLGLFSAKEIVKGHEGAIWVESKPNEGSKFFVELPKFVKD